jgi:hypothetical protein
MLRCDPYCFLRLILATVLVLSADVACPQSSPTNWSKRIISKQERPLPSLVNPHVNDVNVLIIDGRRFEHVRGLAKFYLPAPQIGAVVFVADEKDYSVTYHVFMMDTGGDIAIHAKSSIFGHTIGSANAQDTVEKADSRTIVLCNFDRGARSTLPSLTNLDSVKSLYYLDLDKKSVTEKTLYFDKAGKVIMERGSAARAVPKTEPASPAVGQ